MKYYINAINNIKTLLHTHLILFNAESNVAHVLPPFSDTLSSPFSQAARQSWRQFVGSPLFFVLISYSVG